MKVLICYYSTYGNVYKMAKLVADGVGQVAGAEPVMRRVPELIPQAVVESHADMKAGRDLQKDVPLVPLDDFREAGAIAFGTPTRFGNVLSQLKNQIDQLTSLWLKGELEGKPAGVFVSTGSLHGGQETTIHTLMAPLLHLGIILVGVPYSVQETFHHAGRRFALRAGPRGGRERPAGNRPARSRHLPRLGTPPGRSRHASGSKEMSYHKFAVWIGAAMLLLASGAAESRAQKVHVLMAGDTADPKIGKAVGHDLDAAAVAFFILLRERQLDDTKLRGDEVSAAEILKAIDRFRVQPDEAMVFYWSGHGAFDNDGHYLHMPKGGNLYRSTVFGAMKKKQARLTVLLTDCCNDFSDATAGLPRVSPSSPDPNRPTSPLFETLFVKSRGVVDVNAAAEGEVAMGVKDGGLFSLSLFSMAPDPALGRHKGFALENAFGAFWRNSQKRLSWQAVLVGGIGKTSLVQVGLLIQKLKGKKIIAIGTRRSYLTGSGYKHFKDKCADEIYDVIGGKVTLEDIAIALGIHENLLGKEDSEKINIVLDNINKRNILIFIDDFHLSDDNIRRLVSQANCGIVLA